MHPVFSVDDSDDLHDPGLVIEQICRLCRSSKGVMSYIFSRSGLDTSSPVSERIMNFANIQVNEGDGLPSLICHRCLYHIEKVHEFKMLCEQSDAFLRQHLALQLLTEKRTMNSKSGGQHHLNGSTDNIEQFKKNNNYNWMKEEPVEKDHDPQCDSEDEEFNCPSCNKHFDASSQLDRHVRIHSQEGPFPCDFCHVIEKDKASLRAHWKEHAGKFTNVCQTCGDAFNSKDSLLKHNLRHDKAKPYHCEVCQKAFTYKSDLRKHSIIHTGLRPYVCPICFKSFTRSTNLNKHSRLHSGRRPFACGGCDKMFASRGDLLRHSVIHTGEKPYSCNICSISFNRRDKLTRHEKVHIAGRPHPCTECPTSFNRKEELTKHFQFHHFSPDMFYECGSPISPDVNNFKTENGTPIDSEDGGESETVVISVDPSHWAGEQLGGSRGVETFDEDRPFSCETCPKRFRHRRELKRHSAVHTGHRPFSCFTCGKSFIRSDKLKRHLLIHAEKKGRKNLVSSYQCNVCTQVLPSKLELRNHKLSHLGFKKFKCLHCSTSFSRRSRIVKHIKLMHSYFHPNVRCNSVS